MKKQLKKIGPLKEATLVLLKNFQEEVELLNVKSEFVQSKKNAIYALSHLIKGEFFGYDNAFKSTEYIIEVLSEKVNSRLPNYCLNTVRKKFLDSNEYIQSDFDIALKDIRMCCNEAGLSALSRPPVER